MTNPWRTDPERLPSAHNLAEERCGSSLRTRLTLASTRNNNQLYQLSGSIGGSRQASFEPAAPAAVHRFDVAITHFLQIIGDQRGTESTAAIENYFRRGIRDALLDIPFDHAAAHVHRVGKMTLGPLVVFSDVYE